MTDRKTACIAGAAFALFAATGAAAFAQPVAPPAPGHDHAGHDPAGPEDRSERRMMMHRDGGDGPMAFHRVRDEKAEADHLRAILQLKPGQEAALSAYIAAMKPPEDQMMRRMRDGDGPDGDRAAPPAPKTTPERLALAEKRLTEREAAARARLTATRRFYDQLDPAQKRAYDELAPMMMDGPRGRDRHMGPPMKVMMRRMPLAPPMAAPPPKS